ncbi:hypothetical protein NKG94_47360 [Micromonospora sp. M12]
MRPGPACGKTSYLRGRNGWCGRGGGAAPGPARGQQPSGDAGPVRPGGRVVTAPTPARRTHDPARVAAPAQLGSLLTRCRLARGWSQQRAAAELCAASGVPTLSRHEVSGGNGSVACRAGSGSAGSPPSWTCRWWRSPRPPRPPAGPARRGPPDRAAPRGRRPTGRADGSRRTGGTTRGGGARATATR